MFATPGAACAQAGATAGGELVKSSFHFDPNGGHAFVPVTLNDKTHPFVVDTGCTLTIFDSSLRFALGAKMPAVRIKTPDGVAKFERFIAPRAHVGRHLMVGVSEVLCAELARLRAIDGVNCYGCIGMDFLGSRIVRIDCDHGEAAILSGVPRESGVPIPFSLSPLGLPTVTISIAGTSDISFVVDTGCTSAGTLDSQTFDWLVETGGAKPVGRALSESIAKSRDVPVARLRDLRLGEFRHHGLVVQKGDWNLLGLGYLSRYVVTFDFPRMTMYVKPGARFHEPGRHNLSGAYVWRPDGKTTVRSVDKASAAEAAGLAAGDVFEEIDACSAESLTMRQIRNLLCLPGERIVRVKRAQESLRIVLVLKDAAGKSKAD